MEDKDINILEEFIKEFKETPELILSIKGVRREKEFKAIENLIKRNKELEELLEEKTLRIGFENQDDYIPKSKVREIINILEELL